MEIGVVTSIENACVLPESVAYVEEHVGRFLLPDKEERAFEAVLEAVKGVGRRVPAVCCFVPAALKSVGDELDEERLLEWARITFSRARKAGVEIVVYGSGGSRRIPPGFPRARALEQFIDVLSRMAPAAADHGVTVAVEPLNRGETNFVNSLAEGAEIVRAVSHPAVRLLADIYHMAVDREPPEAIAACAGILVHAHCAEPENRAAPGSAPFDFVPYLRALREAEYDGRVSIECRWNDMEREIGPAVSYLEDQLAKAGF